MKSILLSIVAVALFTACSGKKYYEPEETSSNIELNKKSMSSSIKSMNRVGATLKDNEVIDFCIERGLPKVPMLYEGPYSKEIAYQYTKGPSTYGKQEIREGIVIRDPNETSCFIGKKVIKYISEDYLDLDNTDFH